jgi:O-antigen biosynthesis protein
VAIEYSDGAAVEREILEILDRTAQLGSARSIAADRYATWAVRYHLCAERANLLRHLAFEDLVVLEVGAGMGGVSRFLAEHARSLTVVEGSESRFRALRSRLRDRDNWEGVVANIADVPLARTFDVVCVIGVLEYAELYVPTAPGESPFVKLLESATRHLAPDGVLVLAIENQLGLKYWSGGGEDHVNAPFAGICGYPRGRSPRTFSRRELIQLVQRAGFGTVDEFFPFPDYKVPNSVLSAQFVRLAPEVAASIATAGALDNRSAPRMRLFPEQLAAQTLARAGEDPVGAKSEHQVAYGVGET